MTARPAPTREELHAALVASGVRIDLDTALANPPIARLLELHVEATKSAQQRHQRAPHSSLPDHHWAARIRRLVGDIDHQLLRAGDADRH